jgi:serine/threonine protein kinase
VENGQAPPWTPAAGELVAERFDLEREVARGGMGAIWRAHHVRLDCPVAVKFIDAKYAESEFLRQRFQREARAAARLRSRHVVQILDYGVWKAIPYIAMELLEGEDLGSRLDKQQRLGVAELLSLIKGAVRALSKAADRDIVHRDLKPENLFIVNERGQDYIKVLDFGVAKLRDPNLLDSRGETKAGVVVGTPYYMSPEQADGTLGVDHRSDLWSLAVIIYECLTGELPFYSEAFGNLVKKISSGPIPLPSAIRPELPTAFDAWWEKAASRNPDDRYQNAESFFEALYDALVDARASMSDIPVGRASWVTPRGIRHDSFVPRDRSSSPPDSSPSPSSRSPLSWSGPHSSARPPDSQPPLALPDAIESAGQADSLDEPVAVAPQRETFAGHASSPPAPVRNRRHVGLVVGIVATALVVWATSPKASTVHSGAMARSVVIAAAPAPQAPELAQSTEAVEPPPDARVVEESEKKGPKTTKPVAPEARPKATPAPPEPPPPPEPAASDDTAPRFPQGI